MEKEVTILMWFDVWHSTQVIVQTDTQKEKKLKATDTRRKRGFRLALARKQKCIFLN